MYLKENNYFVTVIIIIMLIKNPSKKTEDYFFLVYIILEKNKDMKVFLTIVLIMSTSSKHIFSKPFML